MAAWQGFRGAPRPLRPDLASHPVRCSSQLAHALRPFRGARVPTWDRLLRASGMAAGAAARASHLAGAHGQHPSLLLDAKRACMRSLALSSAASARRRGRRPRRSARRSTCASRAVVACRRDPLARTPQICDAIWGRSPLVAVSPLVATPIIGVVQSRAGQKLDEPVFRPNMIPRLGHEADFGAPDSIRRVASGAPASASRPRPAPEKLKPVQFRASGLGCGRKSGGSDFGLSGCQ